MFQFPSHFYRQVIGFFSLGGHRGEGLGRRFLWLIVGGLIGFVVWAFISEFDRVVSAEGKVVPFSKLQTVQHLEGGIVTRIHRSMGERIQFGDPLISISPIESEQDYDSKKTEYQRLLARVNRLEAEARGRDPDFEPELIKQAGAVIKLELSLKQARDLKLQSMIDSFDSQLLQKKTELDGLEKTLSLIKEEYVVVKKLVERGLEPKLEAVRAEKSMAEAEARYETLKASMQEIRDRKAIAKQENLAEVLTELANARSELIQISKSLPVAADRAERSTLRSPVAGTINRVLVTTVGGVLKAGEPAVEIVPEDSKMVVQAKILPADIGFVSVGQRAIIKLSTYDYSVFGSIIGTVTVVGSDSLADEKGNTFYLIDITPSSDVSTTGQKLPIMPGMVAQIDVVTGSRSVITYISSPITKTLTSAFREK